MKAAAALVMLPGISPVGAAAQPPRVKYFGSEILRPRKAAIPDTAMPQEAKGRYVLSQFASCLIDTHPKQVSTALSAKPGNDYAALNNVALGYTDADSCLFDGEVRFHPQLLRGALFGELFRRHLAGRDVGVAIEPLDFTQPLPAGAPELAAAHFGLLALADCIALQDADSVRTIVVSRTASRDQEAAYARIVQIIGSCVPQGSKLAITRSVLEGTFGEYLYRSLVPVVRTPAGKAQ